jgi:hypothetical protein
MAEEDPRSIFFGRTYSEFEFSQAVYNYYIHPQWDEFGSKTLYLKILFADYDAKFAIIERCHRERYYGIKKRSLR